MVSSSRFLSSRRRAGIAWRLLSVAIVAPLLGAAPDARGLYEQARAALGRGEMEATLSLVDRALALDRSLAEAHALRAVALDQLERHDEALAAYAEALTLKPDYAEVYHNLALLRVRRQGYPDALEAARKAVQLDPRDIDSFNNLGVAATKLGLLGEAEEALRRALELDPASIGAHYNLALVHAELGRVAKAIEDLEIAYQGAHDAKDQHRRQWIAEVCARLLNRYPEDGAVWRVNRLLGRIYFDQGWFGTSIPYLEAAASRSDFVSLLHLGISYKNKALAPEAVRALRRAVRLRPDDYQARNELGHALGTLAEDWESASEEFQAALRVRPGSAEVHYNLAYALFRQKRYDQARQEFQEAFRLKPEMEESEHYKGLAFPQ
jgi:tetratricopeptide (TPR) repeat protein